MKAVSYTHLNAVNRSRHAEYGAILANELLKGTDLSLENRITIMSAIGNHDESTGGATDPVSAALIIADKTDVRRNRVRDKDRAAFDIHDRVNYAEMCIRDSVPSVVGLIIAGEVVKDLTNADTRAKVKTGGKA